MCLIPFPYHMCHFLFSLFEQALLFFSEGSVVCDGFHGPKRPGDIRLAEGCCKGEVLPEAVWPGGSSSRQDPEPEPGGAEEQQEEGRAETDWFPWGEVWDNRSQPSRESSPVRESETGWSKARGTRGHSKNKTVSFRSRRKCILLVRQFTVLSLKVNNRQHQRKVLVEIPSKICCKVWGRSYTTPTCLPQLISIITEECRQWVDFRQD